MLRHILLKEKLLAWELIGLSTLPVDGALPRTRQKLQLVGSSHEKLGSSQPFSTFQG